ncbi:MAG: signal peptidase II [Alphaproteobacteria bacterium]|nr:signal peptidase II [Alphaproteobacteria bacterium]MBF0250435.1 signal peptidase II [Alphaproteobacteria bacterium]
MTEHRPWGWGLALAILAADQVSKWAILDYFAAAPANIVGVTPYFNIVLAWNPGISFGMFGAGGDVGRWILVALAAVICGVLGRWLMRAETRFAALSLGAIIGGAVGNVIDRVRFGAVVDFLDVHVLGYHWPAFNVADGAITVGATVLILESLFAASKTPTKDVDPKVEDRHTGEETGNGS